MDFSRKCELFHRALASFQVARVRREFDGRKVDRLLAREMKLKIGKAMSDYFFELGMVDLAAEIEGEVVVARHRFDPNRFAVAMKSALLPTGESECGDWERADDAPEAP